MVEIVGIRFKSCGKIYDFDVSGVDVRKGDSVIVESELGLGIGNVVVDKHTVANVSKDLKKVLRKVTDDDIRQKAENNAMEAEARAFCFEKITARKLPMKLVCTETTLDKKRIVFYFTADGRIDFRELVKDLASKFKTRIEMRQIGVRDEARTIGGLGICGRELCCRTFLSSFEPISIKMVKSQDLAFNASKLSGVCGRLMCCLSYEYSNRTDTGAQKGGGPFSPVQDEKEAEEALISPAYTASFQPTAQQENWQGNKSYPQQQSTAEDVESRPQTPEAEANEEDKHPAIKEAGHDEFKHKTSRRKKQRRRFQR